MLRTLLICAVVSASAVACSAAQTRPNAKTAAAAPTNGACQRHSASRIPIKPSDCSSAPGRTYSNEDIVRTGQTNVGDALQMLDPSVSVHH